ncbi:unnamed protein product [Caenorhabditis bovis]|uniref:Uncharacterized protein n=1 Tax=Caenorhabditis bovis TaxID=2654633 RepID=A0A8S1EBH7_9PELO|nr:unnamed protein product [Caenorhabditis bovis]
MHCSNEGVVASEGGVGRDPKNQTGPDYYEGYVVTVQNPEDMGKLAALFGISETDDENGSNRMNMMSKGTFVLVYVPQLAEADKMKNAVNSVEGSGQEEWGFGVTPITRGSSRGLIGNR